MGINLKLKDNALLKSNIDGLQYIESNGNQYIDTECTFPNGFRIVIDYWYRTAVDSNQYGVIFASSDGNMLITSRYSNFQCVFNGTTYGGLNNVLNNTTVYKIEVSTINNKLNLFINDVQKLSDISLTGSYTNSTYYLFRSDNKQLKGRLGRVKIYDHNNVLVRDYIPIKDANNAVCTYDNVSKRYFYNKGTGNFTASSETCSAFTKLPTNITTAYVKDCPNISGIDILRNCLNLTRVRLNIGNVSGSLQELLSYSTLNGFNDNYEPQVKPRLVGTWTVNDWYASEQLSQAQAAFDGLTVIGDPNYLINFDELAVQTLDSTKPNYNPAVAIILSNHSKGITLNNPVIAGQTGRWFITKEQAAVLAGTNANVDSTNSIGVWFYNINTTTDTNGIVSSNTAATYTFTSFNEYQYFIGQIYLGSTVNNTGKSFQNCNSLKYITTPGTILGFYQYTNSANNNNNQVFYLKETSISSLSIGNNNYYFINTSKTSNRYILSAYKDRYKGQQVFESIITPSRLNALPQVKTYYNYCAPKISYDGTNVTITVERDSTIYYTTDGSTPTIESTEYTQPFAWDGQGVIKAMAIDTTNIVGDIAYADDFYADTVADPTVTLDTTNKTITINCATSNATIYYTLDGTFPNLESSVYSEPIETQEDIIKVRCFAVKEGMNNSNVVGKICVLDNTLWGTDGDSSSFAVQCIDDTKPNYNPAVSIILFNNGVFADYIPGYGGYLTKTDAATITNFGVRQSITVPAWFRGKTNVQNEILLPGSYNFESFDEFKYFTSVVVYDGYINRVADGGAFSFCTNLTTITLPPNFELKTMIFSGDTNLQHVNGVENCTTIPNMAFKDCQNLLISSLSSSLTLIGEGAFTNCKKVSFNTLGSLCSEIKFSQNVLPSAFANTTSIPYLHLEYDGVVNKYEYWSRTHIYSMFLGTTYKIYVGNGNQAHDEALLADYVADTNWSAMASDLDSWYNYLHPTT